MKGFGWLRMLCCIAIIWVEIPMIAIGKHGPEWLQEIPGWLRFSGGITIIILIGALAFWSFDWERK